MHLALAQVAIPIARQHLAGKRIKGVLIHRIGQPRVLLGDDTDKLTRVSRKRPHEQVVAERLHVGGAACWIDVHHHLERRIEGVTADTPIEIKSMVGKLLKISGQLSHVDFVALTIRRLECTARAPFDGGISALDLKHIGRTTRQQHHIELREVRSALTGIGSFVFAHEDVWDEARPLETRLSAHGSDHLLERLDFTDKTATH